MEIKARFVDIPALLGGLRNHWLDAFLRQLRFVAQRLSGEMIFQAGDIRFRRHLRHVKAIFRNADRLDPIRQIIHHDPISTNDPFARITIFHLLAGNIQRIAFRLDLRIGKSGIVFQQR